MVALPDDPAERAQFLERWASDQRERKAQPRPPKTGRVPLSARVRTGSMRVSERLEQQLEQVANRVLDHGLDTAGASSQPEHQYPVRVGYLPSPWYVLPRALRCIGFSPDDTFIDFGCGKGRVVHQAAMRPFRRVIGVDISPALIDLARAGAEARGHRYRCRDVRFVAADAAEFPVPDDLTIAYFYHPFGPETLDAVLRNIVESIDRRPRRVRLIYVYPRLGARVLATGRFRLVKQQRGGLYDNRLRRTAIFESS